MLHLTAQWRRRNGVRVQPAQPGTRAALGQPTGEQRRVLTEVLNILGQGEMVTSKGVAMFLWPVRHIFTAEGRALIELYLDDEAFHAQLYISARRAMGLPWRLILNPLLSFNLFSLWAYFLTPLRSARVAQRYARGVLLLLLVSEYLAEPLLDKFAGWLEDGIPEPSTRALVRSYNQNIAKEEHYHKAWVMLYRDLLIEDLPIDVLVDHLKFFLIFSTPYAIGDDAMTDYIRDEYAPYFVEVLRDKLRIPLTDVDAQTIIGRAMELRHAYVNDKQRYGKAIAYFRSVRFLHRWRTEFRELLRSRVVARSGQDRGARSDRVHA